MIRGNKIDILIQSESLRHPLEILEVLLTVNLTALHYNGYSVMPNNMS